MVLTFFPTNIKKHKNKRFSLGIIVDNDDNVFSTISPGELSANTELTNDVQILGG